MRKKTLGIVKIPFLTKKTCWVSLAMVVLIVVVPSLQCAAAESKSQADRSAASSLAPERSFGPASLDPLPTLDFHLYFKDSLIGVTWIDAPITMSVKEDRDPVTGVLGKYMTGFMFDRITASNPLFAPGLLGIGCDSFVCSWYSYNSSGKVYNQWQDGHPTITGYRDLPFWDTTGGEGWYTGSAFAADMQGPVRFGEYLCLDNIRLYSQGNVSVLCSPNSLVLWGEFQWNGTEWTISSQVWDSMSNQTVLGSRTANLSVEYPLDPAKTTIIIGVPSILALIVYWKRDALRGRFHRKSSIGLEGSEYCYQQKRWFG